MRKVVASLVVLALTFLVIVAVLIATGHASTTNSRPHPGQPCVPRRRVSRVAEHFPNRDEGGQMNGSA